MGLDESEVMDDRSLTIEDIADDTECRGRVALGEVDHGGCVAHLAGDGLLDTQPRKGCASLVQHPESGFGRERPTSHCPDNACSPVIDDCICSAALNSCDAA